MIIGNENYDEEDEDDYEGAQEEAENEPGAEMTPPSLQNSAQMPVVMNIKTKTISQVCTENQKIKDRIGASSLGNKPRVTGHMKSPSVHAHNSLLPL